MSNKVTNKLRRVTETSHKNVCFVIRRLPAYWSHAISGKDLGHFVRGFYVLHGMKATKNLYVNNALQCIDNVE